MTLGDDFWRLRSRGTEIDDLLRRDLLNPPSGKLPTSEKAKLLLELYDIPNRQGLNGTELAALDEALSLAPHLKAQFADRQAASFQRVLDEHYPRRT